MPDFPTNAACSIYTVNLVSSFVSAGVPQSLVLTVLLALGFLMVFPVLCTVNQEYSFMSTLRHCAPLSVDLKNNVVV